MSTIDRARGAPGPGPQSAFELLPAIDLRGGQVVRLRQGDFARETAYADDPVAIAESFAGAGATWLHVVDLDGARAGRPAHTGVIERIVAATAGRVAVEVAGGLRTPEAVESSLAAGAARAVVGTAALRDPSFAADLVGRHGPARIVAAIDVRDGLALGDGWRPGAQGLAVGDAVRRLADAGIETFEVTAIDRDGGLGGPDLTLLGALIDLDRGRIVASGGIGSLADLDAVRALGCGGAIVGRALYEGRLDLRQALSRIAQPARPD